MTDLEVIKEEVIQVAIEAAKVTEVTITELNGEGRTITTGPDRPP